MYRYNTSFPNSPTLCYQISELINHDLVNEDDQHHQVLSSFSADYHLGLWNISDGKGLKWLNVAPKSPGSVKKCFISSALHNQSLSIILADSTITILDAETNKVEWTWSAQDEQEYKTVEWELVNVDDHDEADVHQELALIGRQTTNNSLIVIHFNSRVGQILHRDMGSVDLKAEIPSFHVVGDEGRFLIWIDGTGLFRCYDLDANQELYFSHLNEGDDHFRSTDYASKKIITIDSALHRRAYFTVKVADLDYVVDISNNDENDDVVLVFHPLPKVFI